MNRVGYLKFGHAVIGLILLSANYATGQTTTSSPPHEQGKRDLRVSPGMAIVLICLITAFFLMGFISVYVRQCAERGISVDETDGTGSSFRRSRRGGVRGLDPAVINTFPTFLYSDVKGHKIGQRALECAVCLLEFEDSEVLRLLPKCSHVFHPDCIDAWLAFHVTCPVCRANLVPKPGEHSHVTTVLWGHTALNLTESNSPPGNGGSGSNSVRPANDLIIDIDSSTPELMTPNQNRPPRSTPKTARNTGKFPRSHSTGHSVVQPGENCERFTLRLPEDVRNQLVNHTFSRSTSSVAFPRARSTRKGFRSISVGTGRGKNYERFDREGRSGRWNFRMTPPFISRAGSVRSPGEVGDVELTTTPRRLMKSIKSPLDRLFRATDKDDVGERSIDKLRPDSHT